MCNRRRNSRVFSENLMDVIQKNSHLKWRIKRLQEFSWVMIKNFSYLKITFEVFSSYKNIVVVFHIFSLLMVSHHHHSIYRGELVINQSVVVITLFLLSWARGFLVRKSQDAKISFLLLYLQTNKCHNFFRGHHNHHDGSRWS